MRQGDLCNVPRRARRLPELPARRKGRSRDRHASANPGAGTASAGARERSRQGYGSGCAGSGVNARTRSSWLSALAAGPALAARSQTIAQSAPPSASGARVQPRLLWLLGPSVADRTSSVSRLFSLGARPAARAALSRRQRVLRHQDLERRRRTHTGRHQLDRRTASSRRYELAIAA